MFADHWNCSPSSRFPPAEPRTATTLHARCSLFKLLAVSSLHQRAAEAALPAASSRDPHAGKPTPINHHHRPSRGSCSTSDAGGEPSSCSTLMARLPPPPRLYLRHCRKALPRAYSSSSPPFANSSRGTTTSEHGPSSTSWPLRRCCPPTTSSRSCSSILLRHRADQPLYRPPRATPAAPTSNSPPRLAGVAASISGRDASRRRSARSRALPESQRRLLSTVREAPSKVEAPVRSSPPNAAHRRADPRPLVAALRSPAVAPTSGRPPRRCPVAVALSQAGPHSPLPPWPRVQPSQPVVAASSCYSSSPFSPAAARYCCSRPPRPQLALPPPTPSST